MTDFPRTITFLSDDTVAEFVKLLKDSAKIKNPIAEYVFTKSNNNLGKPFPLDLRQINNLYSAGLIKTK